MHLTPEELVDLAEGTRPASGAPHLAACAQCRAQLADLRAMLPAVADVGVPEPSPLFWDHFSQRVHDAVAADAAQARGWRAPGWRAVARRVAWRRASFEPIAALALLLVAVFVGGRALWTSTHQTDPQVAVAQPAGGGTHAELFSDSPVENDPPLALVATLAANLDADTPDAIVSDSGLARIGSADHAVAHMNGAELRELRRILQEEMAP
jgi:hypothetical protein